MPLPSANRWIASTAQDLRYGGRTLFRTPLVTGVMIISIALGIGVATAVFTIADIMLMRPLPFPMADRLVVPFQTVRVQSRAREDTVAWTFARYDLLRQAARGIDDLGFATWTSAIIRLPAEDRPVRVEAITRSLLSTFSMEAQRGRLFAADEDDASVPTTVGMISDRLWRSAYGGNPELVGSTIDINSAPVRIVGIMPRQFNGFTVGADIWLPVRMMARIDPSARWTERLAAQSGTVIARTTAGTTTVTLEKYLEAALPTIEARAADRSGADQLEHGVGVVTLAEARRHPLVKPILELMAAAVIGLLAIVCANIASILLARGHARRGEMGVRIALGASPRRIGRQVLTECAVLAFVALPCGILLGSFCAEALAGVRPALPQNFVLLRGTDLLAGATFEPNFRVLLVGSFVAALSTLLFAIGPAVSAARVDAARLIATSGDLHATAPVRGKQLLVVSQVALATILLISAGLTTRSLSALLRVDLGFRTEGVVTLTVGSSDTTASARIRRSDFIAHLASVPGISGVAMSGCVPFDLACVFTLGVRALGGVGGDRPINAELHTVSSTYFRTMGTPLLSGRVFADEDTTVERTRVVISEAAARELYGNASPIGKQIAFDQPNARRMDVIGVVHDVRFRSMDAAATPAIYLLGGEEAQAPRFNSVLFVRTTMTGVATAATVANEIRAREAPMSVAGARTIAELVRAETSTTRFIAALLTGFALTALVLASLGVYGVVSYTVSQRTKELGLRILLGADDHGLLMGMLMRGVVLVTAGLGSGVVIALATSRLVSTFLFGVAPLDALTYAGVALVVGAVGVVATLLPARRILRIDAATALRA